MAETTEVLVTEFRADIKRFEASMRKQARAAEASSKKMRRDFGKANRQIRSDTNATVRFMQTRFGALAVFAGLRAGTGVIADFGQAMSSVQAVSGATAGELDLLKNKARELGATTRFSATEAAEGMLFLSRAGFTVDETLLSIEGTLQLAQVGMLELGDAADISSNILQGFRLEASEMGRVVDVMAKTVNSSNTDVRQLGDAMKLVAPVAAGMGVEIEETSAAVGALSNAGLQATLAGTGLRRVLAELESPTAASRKILRDMGVTLDEVKPTAVGLTAALDRLKGAGIDTGTALKLFGQRGGPAFEVLSSSIPDIKEMTAEFENAAGTGARMAKIMDDNLAGAMKRALSRLQELVLTLAEAGAEDALIALFESLAFLLTKASEGVHSLSVFLSQFAKEQDQAKTAVERYAEAQFLANRATGEAKENLEAVVALERQNTLEKIKATKAALAQAEAELRLNEERAKRFKQNPFSPTGQKGGLFASEVGAENKRREIAELERAIIELEAEVLAIENGTSELLKTSDRESVTQSTSAPVFNNTPIVSEDAQKKAFDKILGDMMKNLEAAKKQIAGELSMLDKLQDARDEMHGQQLTIIEREYERRRTAIEREILDEERKAEALRLLDEERAEYTRQLREEILGTGESGNPEVDRVRAVEDEKLAVLREALENELITREEFEQRKIELAQQSEEAIARIRTASAQVQLAASEKLFGSLGDLAKEFAGEQSGVYKALFAVEKAFAIASSIIAIQTGVANALSLPFPANLGAAATVAAQGASVISNIRAVSGFRDGGIDIRGGGSGRSDGIPAMISAGESVITARGTAKNAGLLAAINAGEDVQGSLGKMGRGGTVIDASVTIQGNVTEDVLPRLERALDQREQRILAAVPVIARDERIEAKRRGKP